VNIQPYLRGGEKNLQGGKEKQKLEETQKKTLCKENPNLISLAKKP
jgi:hypothetical protein